MRKQKIKFKDRKLKLKKFESALDVHIKRTRKYKILYLTDGYVCYSGVAHADK